MRLGESLGALSLATDLAAGLPLETYAGIDRSRRSAMLGRTMTHLAREAPIGRRLAAVARVITTPARALRWCRPSVRKPWHSPRISSCPTV